MLSVLGCIRFVADYVELVVGYARHLSQPHLRGRNKESSKGKFDRRFSSSIVSFIDPTRRRFAARFRMRSVCGCIVCDHINLHSNLREWFLSLSLSFSLFCLHLAIRFVARFLLKPFVLYSNRFELTFVSALRPLLVVANFCSLIKLHPSIQ